MRQTNYENIMACIQHGCPAIAQQLFQDLNMVCENSNRWLQHQAEVERKRQEKADAQKAEEAKQAAATAAPRPAAPGAPRP